MLFNSIEFLIYFPIVALLYYLLPQKYRHYMLLVASYWFYMSWNPSLVFLILFSTVVTYFCGIALKNTANEKTKKLYVAASFIVCLGILVFFKYYNFLAGSVSGAIGLFSDNAPDITLSLILPVGISFYTFQTLSYVIDVYRGDIDAERDFIYFALFVSYFPQLVAGPIERPENLLPQLRASERPSADDMRDGLYLMATGFFKKVAIADIVAPCVNRTFNNPADATGLQVALGTVLFAVQIYCDFSGYTDIAAGCARFMHVKLMKNFDLPYSAYSVRDFWKRWHISLTSWFRDYLYIPLGGSRCCARRHLFNVMVVFLVSGLWHGASWTFVIWGALHGIYQISEILIDKALHRDKTYEPKGVRRAVSTVVTFILVCFAWIFFRANSISDIGVLLGSLFTRWEFSRSYITAAFRAMGLDLAGVIGIAISMFVMSRLDRGALTQEKAGGRSLVPAFVCCVWVVAVSWLMLLRGDGASSFIYFQF